MRMLLNTDAKRVESIIKAIRRNDGNCPCRPVVDGEDSRCPCIKFLTENECCCKLFVPADEVEGDKNEPE